MIDVIRKLIEFCGHEFRNGVYGVVHVVSSLCDVIKNCTKKEHSLLGYALNVVVVI